MSTKHDNAIQVLREANAACQLNEDELAAAKAEAAHYMSVAQKATDELAAASQAYDRVMAIHGTVLEDLAVEREKVRVLQEALALAAEESGELTGWYLQQALAALAATKEETT